MTTDAPGQGGGCGDVRNATVTPAAVDMAAAVHIGFSARDGAGRFIEGMKLARSYGTSGEAQAVPARTELPGRWVYGGYLSDHFGHFLVESLARHWYLRQDGGAGIAWHARPPRLRPWQVEVFELIGLDPARFHLIREPTRFEALCVPAPGAVLGSFYEARQARALAVWPFRAPRPGKRVWLSRSRFAEAVSRIEGEAETEALLEGHGWIIFHPQAHPIRAQLAMLEDAEVIAGLEGSAFHTLLLAADVRARIRIVPRGRRLFHAFTMIAEAKGLDQAAVPFEMSFLDGHHRRVNYALTQPGRDALRLLEA